MSLRLSVLLVIAFLLFNCDDEEAFVLEPLPVYPLPENPFAGYDPDFTVATDTCDVQIGRASLIPTSFQLLPYEVGDEITFINDQGQEAGFTVNEWTVDSVESSNLILVDSQDGMSVDSIYACHGGEVLRFRLESEDLQSIITCILIAFPNYLLPERPPIDRLIIFNRVDSDNSNVALYKSTDRSGTPYQSVSHSVTPQLTLNGRVFQHVETAVGVLDHPLWYTQRLGVVGFTDVEGNLWRLR